MQISIELPSDFVAFQDSATIVNEARIAYALWLYRRERITLGKAAEVAGVDLYDFMTICKGNDLPVIDIGREELLEELSGFPGT